MFVRWVYAHKAEGGALSAGVSHSRCDQCGERCAQIDSSRDDCASANDARTTAAAGCRPALCASSAPCAEVGRFEGYVIQAIGRGAIGSRVLTATGVPYAMADLYIAPGNDR